VRNPVACKLGPTAAPSEALALCDRLNPENEPGRLTFITRMGAPAVEEKLPPLLSAVRKEGREIVWVCDPMHGNTFMSSSGKKTRRLDDIFSEIKGFFAACGQEETVAGGVHLELTHEDVTECLGGAEEVLDEHLKTRYQALCDPRLNARQSLDLAFQLGELIRTA
jgi:3-deoxy-7-phosphoheptulonate synthase